LNDGTVFYIVEAYNAFGTRLSNCINVTVKIPGSIPGEFNLSTDAGNPDTDGEFTLNWTASSGAVGYKIYSYNGTITKINSSVHLLNDTTKLNYSIVTSTDNTTFYIVQAYNAYGNRLSNCIDVTVQIPPSDDEIDDDENGENGDGFASMILPLTLIIVIPSVGVVIVLLIIIKKKRG
jgi:hypothetical protein